jgi:hypothetical protein
MNSLLPSSNLREIELDMYAFCTYCSKNKSETSGEIPASERYRSIRLEAVHDAARRLGLRFFILSGEYGLIPPEQPIPWYDHRLLTDEVPTLASQVLEQIARRAITHLVYFTESLRRDPNVAPYQAVIMEACQRAGVSLFTVEIDESSLLKQIEP